MRNLLNRLAARRAALLETAGAACLVVAAAQVAPAAAWAVAGVALVVKSLAIHKDAE